MYFVSSRCTTLLTAILWHFTIVIVDGIKLVVHVEKSSLKQLGYMKRCAALLLHVQLHTTEILFFDVVEGKTFAYILTILPQLSNFLKNKICLPVDVYRLWIAAQMVCLSLLVSRLSSRHKATSLSLHALRKLYISIQTEPYHQKQLNCMLHICCQCGFNLQILDSASWVAFCTWTLIAKAHLEQHCQLDIRCKAGYTYRVKTNCKTDFLRLPRSARFPLRRLCCFWCCWWLLGPWSFAGFFTACTHCYLYQNVISCTF